MSKNHQKHYTGILNNHRAMICVVCRKRITHDQYRASRPEGAPADAIGFYSFDPDDRFFHAADKTWWRRGADGSLVCAEPPNNPLDGPQVGKAQPAADQLLIDERKAFDAWINDTIGAAFSARRPDGRYVWDATERDWLIWQAALGASIHKGKP